MARRAPGDNVLPNQFQMVAPILTSDWCKKTFVFFCLIRRQNDSDHLELVWSDIVPRGSSRRSLLFFVPCFSTRIDFPLPPLSAPGSSRMSFAILAIFFTFSFFDSKNNNLLQCTFAIFGRILEGLLCLSSS